MFVGLQSLGTKRTLNPLPTLQNNEPVLYIFLFSKPSKKQTIKIIRDESWIGFELPCWNTLIRYTLITWVIKIPTENDMVQSVLIYYRKTKCSNLLSMGIGVRASLLYGLMDWLLHRLTITTTNIFIFYVLKQLLYHQFLNFKLVMYFGLNHKSWNVWKQHLWIK